MSRKRVAMTHDPVLYTPEYIGPKDQISNSSRSFWNDRFQWRFLSIPSPKGLEKPELAAGFGPSWSSIQSNYYVYIWLPAKMELYKRVRIRVLVKQLHAQTSTLAWRTAFACWPIHSASWTQIFFAILLCCDIDPSVSETGQIGFLLYFSFFHLRRNCIFRPTIGSAKQVPYVVIRVPTTGVRLSPWQQ